MKLTNLKNKIPEDFYNILEKEKIDELRPCQVKAIDAGLFENKNLLICTPTASGKTLVAELCAIKGIVENQGKVIYVVPLRSLATEKFNDFKKRYAELGVKAALSIGDLDSNDSYLAKYDLIVCTSEKLDSLMRRNVPWINDVKLIVIDEIHLINDVERGPTLEVLITMLRRSLKNLQIIALSATIGNPEELAEWLDANLVLDDWRPVKLYEGILHENKIDFFDKKENLNIKNNDEEVIDLVIDTLNKNKQALIFVNTKKGTEALAEKIALNLKNNEDEIADKILNVLSNPTEQCKKLSKVVKKGVAFHHSGLMQKQRELIENSFREGKIKFICCTPTLALGVSLPAFRAIIKDLRRYGNNGLAYIPVLEYLQMAGRCGRPEHDNYGEAICIAKSEREKELIYDRYINGDVEDIQSKLAVEPVLRMYLLSLIASEFVNTEKEIFDFFNDTFFAYQYEDMGRLENKIERILELLEDYKFIYFKDNKYNATLIGKRISELYLDPETGFYLIRCIKDCIKETKEIALLQAVCNTLEMKPLLNVRKSEEDIMENELAKVEHLLLKTSDEGFEDEFLSSFKTALMFNSWINERTEEDILEIFGTRPGELNSKLQDVDWLLYSFEQLAVLSDKKEILSNIARLRIRLKYGVKEELLPLVKLRGIGRVRGRRLFNRGIKDIKEIKKAEFNVLKEILGEKVANDLHKQSEEQKTIEQE